MLVSLVGLQILYYQKYMYIFTYDPYISGEEARHW